MVTLVKGCMIEKAIGLLPCTMPNQGKTLIKHHQALELETLRTIIVMPWLNEWSIPGIAMNHKF